jgi:hypothetical protein
MANDDSDPMSPAKVAIDLWAIVLGALDPLNDYAVRGLAKLRPALQVAK